MSSGGCYDAIVLAGGRSSRMGDVDKTGLVVSGRTLLTLACDAVAGARGLVVVGPQGLTGVPGRAVRVQEDPPFGGPAAAIGAGLAAHVGEAADIVVVLAADVPRAREAVPLLLDALDAHPAIDGVVPVSSDGHRQPLLAAYRRALLAQVLAAAAPLANRSVNRVVASMDLLEIGLPDAVLADVDTPDDLRRATHPTKETDHG